ncbi:hypothetical protein V5T82_10885 [Magnetovibrio sp. PR-2]|uniref:hypothetical protein n=1 Tax=Magnetovibrio sp. PR-2 TaxID=3120356 RepID=UPI002FCE014D
MAGSFFGPVAGSAVGSLAGKYVGDYASRKISEKVGGPVGQILGGTVGGFLGNGSYTDISGGLKNAFTGAVGNYAAGKVSDTIGGPLGSTLGNALGSSLQSGLSDTIDAMGPQTSGQTGGISGALSDQFATKDTTSFRTPGFNGQADGGAGRSTPKRTQPNNALGTPRQTSSLSNASLAPKVPKSKTNPVLQGPEGPMQDPLTGRYLRVNDFKPLKQLKPKRQISTFSDATRQRVKSAQAAATKPSRVQEVWSGPKAPKAQTKEISNTPRPHVYRTQNTKYAQTMELKTPKAEPRVQEVWSGPKAHLNKPKDTQDMFRAAQDKYQNKLHTHNASASPAPEAEPKSGRTLTQKQRKSVRHGKPVHTGLDGRTLKGTTFFGGAGMEGGYIEDMVHAMEEAGLKNVRAADPDKWSNGNMFADAAAVPFRNSRDRAASDFSGFGEQGDQFNLVGYSYGGLKAAQAAIDYADEGGTVDNLVLMGTPVEKGFLEKLQNHPNIKSVRVVDLKDQNDPIKAGMSDVDVMMSVPVLANQHYTSETDRKIGHFYYSGDDDVGKQRRRALSSKFAEWGLR